MIILMVAFDQRRIGALFLGVHDVRRSCAPGCGGDGLNAIAGIVVCVGRSPRRLSAQVAAKQLADGQGSIRF
jgi:hypothetical protein